ncbi:TetR/AcrR family transcriptional regulator, partial [Bordetella pertussis]|uniref:TetR/AcrR family transcriptional regulator n=1 Tax=Bordetella pertussis TaxID=520 RepID=UPI0021CB1CD7
MAERGRPRSFERTEALRQAMEVFWSKGYEGASLADLTSAMGINAPSLYAAFGSKEALFREAVQRYADTEGARTRRALLEAPDARAAIEGMLLGGPGAACAGARLAVRAPPHDAGPDPAAAGAG